LSVTFVGLITNNLSGRQVRANDEQLRAMMIGGLAGDAHAYQALLTALVPLLRSFFGRRLSGAADDVEDLVQETLIAIHTRRATYDRERPFTAWFYAVARYKLIDHQRRFRYHVTMEGLEDILADEGFEDATAARMDMDRLLATLPVKQAQAIRQTKIEGLSVAEAAQRGGISEADVKVSVHRGLKMLMSRLRGH
jgi:RNA polymerase sigma-70 factor (ECF subfamily)